MYIDKVIILPMDRIVEDKAYKWITKIEHGDRVDEKWWEDKRKLIEYLRSVLDFLEIQE